MKDDFWDIDKLLPYRPARRRTSVPGETETHEVTSGSHDNSSVPISELVLTDHAPANVCEYDYSSQSIILSSAVISDWQGSYSYSNDFHANAHKVHGIFPERDAPFTPFFSYMPQYSDLSSSQYAFYLTWRDNVRKGNYPKTDTSYIFLYIYEIFALDDILDHKESLEKIIDLWNAYNENHPPLSKHLCEWIVDYALIHNVSIPLEKLSAILPNIRPKHHSILSNMYLFDYLFTSEERITSENIRFACEVLCNYSPFTTRYYEDENYRNLFDKCTVEIFKKMYELGYFSHDNYSHLQQEVKLSRPSYLSAVCSAKNKKSVTVIYRPYSSSELLKIAFSNILKHIENKIRIHLGYKSRLSGIVLNDGMRELIDNFMKASYPPPTKAQRTLLPPPSSPCVQSIKKVEINFENAKKIEDASWKTTEKLTEGIEIQYDDAEQIAAPSIPSPDQTEDTSLISILTSLERETVRMLLDGESYEKIQEFLLSKGALPDAVIDSVNEKALEVIGDTVIDTSDYTIIQDYIDELSSF